MDEMALTELPVRVRFPRGCRVKLSEEGLRHLHSYRGMNETLRATVVGYSPRLPDRIAVVKDGCKSRDRYRARFWERTEE